MLIPYSKTLNFRRYSRNTSRRYLRPKVSVEREKTTIISKWGIRGEREVLGGGVVQKGL